MGRGPLDKAGKEQAEGIEYIGFEDGCKVYRLGSGSYRLTTSLTTGVSPLKADAGGAPHPLYDLSGRRVSPLASASQALRRGLYVSSGRKVVVQ